MEDNIEIQPVNDGKVVILGLVAVAKLIVNILIGLADFIPYIGAIFSWSADGWKSIAPHVGKRLRAEYGIDLDLTSGVSKKVAWISELLEFLSGSLSYLSSCLD